MPTAMLTWLIPGTLLLRHGHDRLRERAIQSRIDVPVWGSFDDLLARRWETTVYYVLLSLTWTG